jgi:hypothetical protein
MKIRITFFVIAFTLHCFAQNQIKYSPHEVKEDLEFLYGTLDKSHYDLYANTKKEIFDEEFKRIINSIEDSLELIQINRLFQPFTALAKHAHCSVMLPFDSYVSYLKEGGTVFPFNVIDLKHHIYITDNYSSDSTIKQGDELLSINGKPMEKVMQKLYTYLSGESEYVKSTLAIGLYSFPRLYWMVNDRCDEFSVKIKKNNGKAITSKVKAILAGEFEGKNSQKKPVLDPAREFKFVGDVAYYHPGQFVNNNISDELDHTFYDAGEFNRFLDSSFAEIHKRKTEYLIIDLRGNPGGANTFSDPMVAYFANKPFKFCSKFLVRTSQNTKDFWKGVNIPILEGLKSEILSHENGSRFEYSIPLYEPRKDSLHFDGKIYVLIDRYSYSNATATAAMIQDYGFGKLVGEQTADIPTTFGSAQNFKLPNTQIIVTYPKALTIRPNGDMSSNGTIPDYKIEDNIFTPEDEILNYILKLIKENK